MCSTNYLALYRVDVVQLTPETAVLGVRTKYNPYGGLSVTALGKSEVVSSRYKGASALRNEYICNNRLRVGELDSPPGIHRFAFVPGGGKFFRAQRFADYGQRFLIGYALGWRDDVHQAAG